MLVAELFILLGALTGVSVSTQPAPIAKVTTSCTQASPSSEYQCDVEGSYELRQNFEYSTEISEAIEASSVEECAYYCSRRVINEQPEQLANYIYCGSFQFDPHYKSCQLLNGNLTYLLLNETKRGPQYIYNDIECFDCGNQFCNTTDGQPYGEQLLDNGEFENGFSLGLWTAENVGIESHGNNTYVELAGPDELGVNPSLVQSFNVCPGQYYEISFDYSYKNARPFNDIFNPQTIAATKIGDLYHDFWATGIGKASIGASEGSGIRGHARYVYQAPKDSIDSGRTVSFLTKAKGENWTLTLDNIAATRRRPPRFAPASGSVSPVPNGGFESGRLAPWRLSQYPPRPQITSPGLKGSQYALNFTLLSHQTVYYTLTSAKFATKPQTMYLMSVDLAPGKDTKVPASNQLVVAFFAVSDGAVTSHTFEALNLQSKKSLSWPLWVNGKTAQIIFQITYFSSGKSHLALLVDNIRFDQTGE